MISLFISDGGIAFPLFRLTWYILKVYAYGHEVYTSFLVLGTREHIQCIQRARLPWKPPCASDRSNTSIS